MGKKLQSQFPESGVDIRDDMICRLSAAKIASPRLEAGIILQKAAPSYPNLTAEEKAAAYAMLSRRLRHEPLDKIIGCREFYKSVFKVNGDVLSPRPDTEILVEKALALLPEDSESRILDLGTGSGCILLSLLAERKQAVGVGLDVSPAALAVAAENAEALGLGGRCRLLAGSWNDTLFSSGSFDMIVSNPPYIAHDEIEKLDTEVKDFDPPMALDGGADGYGCYREIAALAPVVLKKGGFILLESGAGQAERITEIFIRGGLELVETAKDLAGINRCVILKK